MAQTFRITTYYFDDGPFSGTTYDLTLNNDLEPNYFAIVQFGGNGTTTTTLPWYGPSGWAARITADPFGTGDLSTSGSSDVITLTRSAATNDWNGSVTIVECLGNASVSGFTLLDVIEVSITSGGTTNTGTSSAWNDIDQVALFGGHRGGGVVCNNAVSSASPSLEARIYPSSTTTVNVVRNNTGNGAVTDATWTIYVVEMGSEWDMQRVTVSGSAGAAGAASAAAYDKQTISSTVRANTFVLGYGETADGGIGDSFCGCVVTLGDGLTENASETQVAVGGEYADTRNTEVYVFEHTGVSTDYQFKVDGETNDFIYDYTVPSPTVGESITTPVTGLTAIEGYRIPIIYNTQNGTGTAFPRPYFCGHYTSDTNMRMTRTTAGQPYAAWVQSTDLGGVTYTTAAPSTADSLFFGMNF